MKQGKLIRRAVSAALAGCMMFTFSAPALAESTDALMQLSISGNRAASVLDAENGAEEIKINNEVINPADYDNIVINNKYTFRYDPVQKVLTSTSTIPIRFYQRCDFLPSAVQCHALGQVGAAVRSEKQRSL